MLIRLLLLLIACNSYAFTWGDLWATKDQQGHELMRKGQFKQAQSVFNEPAWRASAAYRAGDYQKAAQTFGTLQTEQGYYNQGNALAHLGKYEEAINAYNKALSLNAANKDAQYNRHLLEELLKKQKEKEANSEQNKKQQASDPKNKQDQQDKQSSAQNKEKSEQQQSNKTDEQKDNSDKNQQNQQANNQQNQSTQQNSPDNQEQETDKQTKQNQQKQDNKQQTTEKDKQSPNKTQSAKQTQAETSTDREKKQAKEQWLRLIPDDPGGLLREKFLRDYIRRQHGWYQ
nr:tetratricopeptide repeat protein [Legionella beliardensis]